MWDKKIVEPQQKILTLLVICCFVIILVLVFLIITGILNWDINTIIYDFTFLTAGLVITFILNIKQKTGIAKILFIIFPFVISIKHFLINRNMAFIPVLISFLVIYPVYVCFFIHPKAGLTSGSGLVLCICCYCIYLQIIAPDFFYNTHALTFTEAILSPLVLLFIVTIISYYFSSNQLKYIQEIEHSATHSIAILNAVTDIFLVLDPNGMIKTVNKAGLQILKYPQDEMTGKPVDIFFTDKNEGKNLINKVHSNINFNNYKSVLKTKDGKEIITGINCSAIYTNDKKRIKEIIITARDLTRLYKYTKKLKRMNKKANSHQIAMLNMLEDLHEKNRVLSETEHRVKEYSRLLEENIEQAKEHQAKLIAVKPLSIHNIRFSSEYIPCEKVGGDIINIIALKDSIFFYIADVVGHGVPAAILSSFIKASLDNWIREEAIISPSILLHKLYNVLIGEAIFKEKFFTIFIGKIILKTLELQYISAGHLSPILFNLDTGEVKEIKTRSRPVISMFALEDNKQHSLQLPEKSRILVYSDGLIEWEIEKGEFFGKSKLFKYFEQEKLSKENLHMILQRVKAKQLDDISFILIEINNSYERRLYCRLNHLDQIVSEFRDEIKGRYTKDVTYRVSRCFQELITNAVKHGNRDDENKETYVKALFGKNMIFLFIKDSGHGFNWKALNLSQKQSDTEEDNHGLFYVSHCSNSLEFNDKGNEIRCTFHI
ncbi:MAG: SpoIIE family protein phosphatase [Spirochaetales bacterium]|nr:SpoIIE family protein phosphatase [Spirochaetales bacterium]